jgi:ATP-dependent Lon protease
MIQECIRQEEVFGVVYYDGTNLYETGCTARVVDVLKKYPDGRMDIVTQGEDRFVTQMLFQKRPFMEARIMPLDDVPEQDPQDLRRWIENGLTFLQELAERTQTKADQIELPKKVSARTFSFLLPANDVFSLIEKQSMLEMTSVSQRIKKGVRALEKAIQRVRLTDEIHHLISGNGRLTTDHRSLLEAYTKKKPSQRMR